MAVALKSVFLRAARAIGAPFFLATQQNAIEGVAAAVPRRFRGQSVTRS
jgi:hypothetical protein